MTKRVASLGIYDHPAQRGANDAIWSDIARRLRARGIEAPRTLDRTRSVEAIWRDAHLLFAQACGLPLVTATDLELRIIGIPDTVALRTRPGVTTMTDLVRSTMRLRPDRIIVGEVRGPEAIDMLKAWNTGHPGGIATAHANSAAAALHRIEQLVQEAVVTVPRRLIAEAIDLIVFIAGRGNVRRVETIARVSGIDPDGGYALFDMTHKLHPEGD